MDRTKVFMRKKIPTRRKFRCAILCLYKHLKNVFTHFEKIFLRFSKDLLL